jgi:hypothetical protein
MSKHSFNPLCITAVTSCIKGTSAQGHILVHHRDHRLTYIDVNSGIETLIDKDIDQFWVDGTISDQLVYFTFNHKTGVKLNIETLNSKQVKKRMTILSNDTDSYPLGLSKKAGVFINAMQSVSLKLGKVYHELLPKVHPYVHCVLLSLIVDHQQNLAFQYAQSLKGKPTFVATLEWLLHIVLDENDSIYIDGNTSRTPNTDQDLALVVKFLQRFPQIYGNK